MYEVTCSVKKDVQFPLLSIIVMYSLLFGEIDKEHSWVYVPIIQFEGARGSEARELISVVV